ncbi:MAG: DUF4331 domain-containing protein [Myxococcaceae bacterium]
MKKLRRNPLKVCLALTVALAGAGAFASSHREAPFITRNPKVDATDFYLFQSYEAGRTGFTTIIANYQPLQNKYGGPNFFEMDPNALYEIHIDNGSADGGSTADAVEDLTFQFRFSNPLVNNGAGVELPIGLPDGGGLQNVGIPLRIAGPVTGSDPNLGAGSTGNIASPESFTITLVNGPRRGSAGTAVTNAADGGSVFTKPLDNMGTKTFGNGYEAYARQYIYDITIPGCATAGKVFVGQRAESFAVNLGRVFDLVNAGLAAVANGGETTLTAGAGRALLGPSPLSDMTKTPIGDHNITTIALELPTSCIIHGGSDTIVGAWTTASVRQARVINPTATYSDPAREGGAWTQVSRLSNPLVNEVVIGLADKDRFNSSEPKDDAQFAKYITNPTLPTLIELIYGSANAPAPQFYPRNDLVQAFATGFTGATANGSFGEMLRLNTADALGPPNPKLCTSATDCSNLQDLGAATCVTAPTASAGGHLDTTLAGCDVAGFPNGRRPGDDVTDVALRVVMGVLLPSSLAPAGGVPLTDAVSQNHQQFDPVFPYLRTPNSPD